MVHGYLVHSCLSLWMEMCILHLKIRRGGSPFSIGEKEALLSV